MPMYITLKSVRPVGVKPGIFSIGGFGVSDGDRTICFDFEEFSANAKVLNDNTLEINARCKSLDTESFPESRALTDEFLSKSQIVEIYYEALTDPEEQEHIPLKLDSMHFDYDSEETSLHYSFTSEQIEEFNNNVM